MHVTKILFMCLKGQRVKITCKSFSESVPQVFEGVAIDDTSTGLDSFIELDSGDIINTKYIESIKILG